MLKKPSQLSILINASNEVFLYRNKLLHAVHQLALPLVCWLQWKPHKTSMFSNWTDSPHSWSSTFQVFYFKLYHRTISQIVCLEKRRVGPRGIEPHTQSIDWAKSSVARRDWNWPFKLQCRLAFLIETVIPYIAWYYMYIIQCYISKSKFIIQYVNTTNVKRYINVTGSCDSFCCSF